LPIDLPAMLRDVIQARAKPADHGPVVGGLLPRLPVILERERRGHADKNNDQLERKLTEKRLVRTDVPTEP